jgi:SAM-dependent methyltransferase
MPEKKVDTSRLRDSGWNSFPPELFLNEPGRASRDVGDEFVRLIRDFSKGKRLLEVCSGGGKLLVHLAKAGFEVVGVELSEEMLNICGETVNKEASDIQERIRLVHGDMCTFQLSEMFDFVILEDDALVLALTQEDQLLCLKTIRRHMKEDGYLFLTCTTPQKEMRSKGTRDYDPIEQVKTEQSEWAVPDESGKITTVRKGIERRRFVYPPELELLLRIAGLRPVERWGDLDRNPFTNPETQEYCYLIQKT